MRTESKPNRFSKTLNQCYKRLVSSGECPPADAVRMAREIALAKLRRTPDQYFDDLKKSPKQFED